MSSLSDSLLKKANLSTPRSRPRIAPKVAGRSRTFSSQSNEATEIPTLESSDTISEHSMGNLTLNSISSLKYNTSSQLEREKSPEFSQIPKNHNESSHPNQNGKIQESFKQFQSTPEFDSVETHTVIKTTEVISVENDDSENFTLDLEQKDIQSIQLEVQIGQNISTLQRNEHESINVSKINAKTYINGVTFHPRKRRKNDEIDVDLLEGSREAPVEINSEEEYSPPKTIRSIVMGHGNGKKMSIEATRKLSQMRQRGKDVMDQRKKGELVSYSRDWRFDATDFELHGTSGNHEPTIGDIVNNDEFDELDPSQLDEELHEQHENEFQNQHDDEFEEVNIRNRASSPISNQPVNTEIDLDNLFARAPLDANNARDIFNSADILNQNFGDFENYDEYTRTEESFGDRTYINQLTFARRPPTARWRTEEILKLHDAIRMFGTDFSLISRLFPNRTRREIKNKFSSEEKRNPDFISDLMNSKKSIDVNKFMEESRKKDEQLGIVRDQYVGNDDMLDGLNEDAAMDDEWDHVDETAEPIGKGMLTAAESARNQNSEEEWDELNPENNPEQTENDKHINVEEFEKVYNNINF